MSQSPTGKYLSVTELIENRGGSQSPTGTDTNTTIPTKSQSPTGKYLSVTQSDAKVES